ncbi:MAG: TonB-dependent receptor plug domain-containing protein [Saprospiraceae bacterium]|nr:TonB-dependent receptor plug domain-containing protein [Saprospiraceae bacterium]
MHRIIILIVLLGSPFFTAAQSISGKVWSTENFPIQGAYLYSNDPSQHTHTNQNGIFELENVQIGDSLFVSHLGYVSQWIEIESLSKELRITLEESPVQLDEVLVSSGINAQNIFTAIDLKTNPVSSAQQILRSLPGLVIGQHAGGGKAEQIFLRGFDIDHGTDINITVDGMPVNMVSHAHGQGYADLHFLIPEIINNIDFGKGPYYANQGNFNTAGYVDFQTKDRLSSSAIQLEKGQFNTSRLLGLFRVLDTEKQSAWIASEYLMTDGPFESPQHFNRLNIMGKYTAFLPSLDKISVSASHFTSTWDASGQIPQRQVDQGEIGRFGSIDDTEGGQTSRSNLNLEFTKFINSRSFIRNSAYYAKYDFELFSNFTFFLDDPVNGDQIRQFEDREIFGMQSEWNNQFQLGSSDGLVQIGIGFRKDNIEDNTLSHTLNRKTTLDQIKLGEVNETNTFAYVNSEWKIGKWIINPGLRLDQFQFNYNDALEDQYQTLSVSKAIISPKLNFFYSYSDHLQLFLKTGKGFHSNDTRVVVSQQGKQILPAAYGADLGAIFKPGRRLLVNTALWYLFLEQEFVYVGDAGIVEPSGKTQRAGIDVGLRYQLCDWLFLNTDINYAYARSLNVPEGDNYIPLAPDLTANGGLSIQHPNGIYGGLRYRYVKNRPANENNSIIAEGYSIFDLNGGYKFGKLDIGFAIENLLNTEWKETQFATESRLAFETEPVEEIHFTPGTPFFLKGMIRYNF